MALPNGDLITTVFDPQMAYPVDKRMQVDTLNSRDSMSMFIRWEGMEVYVLENKTKYILQGGRSNEFWKEQGTGSGTGGTTFVGQFETADLLPTTGRSAGDYAFVGTGDDFVQYNWDNIANQWVMAEGQTDMASEFFHIGYKTPLRRPIIFPLFPKDVLVQESGDFVFAPETAVARFIFVGEVTAIRGIETAAADREIKLVNRTGSDIPLRDKAPGIPSDSGFDFGGTDYTWVNGSEITLKGNGTYWELAPNNQIAFSDHLDSVNAQVSVGSDGLLNLSKLLSLGTGEEITYKERSTWFDGIPMNDSHVDGTMVKKLRDNYLFASDIHNNAINIERFRLPDDTDHDVIQKAFDFISSSKTGYQQFFLRIPSGKTYDIDSTLYLNTHSDVFLVGDGWRKSTIRATSEMDDMIVLGNGGGPFVGRCYISGITFNGGSLASCCLNADGTRYSLIEKNEFVNVKSGGIALKLSGWVQKVFWNIFSNQNDNENLTAIRFADGSDANNVSILGNSIARYNVGLRMDDALTSVNVKYNCFDSCEGTGIYFTSGSRGLSIDYNYFERCGMTGLEVQKGGEGSDVETWKGAILGHHNYNSSTQWINGLSIQKNQFANCSDEDNGLITLSGIDYAEIKGNHTYLAYNNKYFVDLRWRGVKYQTASHVVIEHSPYSNDQFEQLVGLNADSGVNEHCGLIIKHHKQLPYLNQYSLPIFNNPVMWGANSWTNFHESEYSYRGGLVWEYRGHASNQTRTLTIDLSENPNLRDQYYRVNWFHKSDSSTSVTFTFSVDSVVDTNITSSSSGSWTQGGRNSTIYIPKNAATITFELATPSLATARLISGFSLVPASYGLHHDCSLKPTKLSGGIYYTGGSPEGFQKAKAGRLCIDLTSGNLYRKTTAYEDVEGWVEVKSFQVADQSITNEGVNDSLGISPLKLSNYTGFVSNRGIGLDNNNGEGLVGTASNGAIVRTTVSGGGIGNGFPTSFGEIITINGANANRSYSLFKDRDSNGLWMQSYNTSGLGLGWIRINPTNASTTQRGIIEQATNSETITGTDTERAVSPANLQAKLNSIILSETATLDFPVIAAGESAQLTATVTGAEELDPVEVGAPATIYNSNGADVKGFVSGPNTVTIRIRNNGASSIDPGESDFKIKVFK